MLTEQSCRESEAFCLCRLYSKELAIVGLIKQKEFGVHVGARKR
jgi:hypothetical protein